MFSFSFFITLTEGVAVIARETYLGHGIVDAGPFAINGSKSTVCRCSVTRTPGGLPSSVVPSLGRTSSLNGSKSWTNFVSEWFQALEELRL